MIAPSPTTELGERQQQLPPFITRYVPQWSTPIWLQSAAWRRVVRQQPVAIDSRDFIISSVAALPWRIVAREAEDTDKHQTEIDYYTTLFETQDGGYLNHIELVMQDMLDLPFGGAAELGRENDSPEGRVLWIKHIDGGTLFPTYSSDFPVGQRIKELAERPVYFPEHAIARAYYTPRPEILRRGWGMAPPEKIFLAIQLLFRGDAYYANLLIDTPEAGILDLGDMSATAAQSWLTSWQDMMLNETNAFKVPVLYEHTTPSKYIPFGRSPVELSYEKTTLRYAQFVASNYGVTLPDIGIMEGDMGTLAGTIRGERRTNRSGLATARQKITYYRNQMLPEFLRFELVIQDDELLVAKGRARLANATAVKSLVDAGILTTQDAQEQLVADGLITVPLEPMQEVQALLNPDPTQGVKGFLRPPVPASEGGEGEVTARALFKPFLENATLLEFQRLSRIVEKKVGDLAVTAKNTLKPQDLLQWRTNLSKPQAMGIAGVVIDVERSVFNTLVSELESNTWWKLDVDHSFVSIYEDTIKSVGEASVDHAYIEGGRVPAFVAEKSVLKDKSIVQQLSKFTYEAVERANAQIMQMLSREVVLATLTELSKERQGSAAMIAKDAFFDKLGSIVGALDTEVVTWIRDSVISQMIPEGVIPEKLWSGE